MPINDGNNTTGPNDETLSILKDSNGNEAKIAQDHLQIVINQADFRLMITYQAKIIKELAEIKEILKEIGE